MQTGRGTRRLKASAIALILLAITVLAAIQLDAFVFRTRARKLVSDFQSIRINKSNWNDAQRIINHWGKFGHANGICSWQQCRYVIDVAAWPNDYSGETLGDVLHRLGVLDNADGHLSFYLENGVIKRDDMYLELNDLRWTLRASDHLQEQSRDSEEPPIWGPHDQLAEHPEYIAGRPNACTICRHAIVTFTPFLDTKELRRLSTFNISCFRSWGSCSTLSDLAPAEAEWNFYRKEHPYKTPDPCNVKTWVLARDSPNIALVSVDEVKSLTTPPSTPQESVTPEKYAHVHVLQAFSGTVLLSGSHTWLEEFYSDEQAYTAENMQVGQRYILFFINPPKDNPPALNWCVVRPDTPEAEAEIKQGISRRDPVLIQNTFMDPTW